MAERRELRKVEIGGKDITDQVIEVEITADAGPAIEALKALQRLGRTLGSWTRGHPADTVIIDDPTPRQWTGDPADREAMRRWWREHGQVFRAPETGREMLDRIRSLGCSAEAAADAFAAVAPHFTAATAGLYEITVGLARDHQFAKLKRYGIPAPLVGEERAAYWRRVLDPNPQRGAQIVSKLLDPSKWGMHAGDVAKRSRDAHSVPGRTQ